MKQDHGLIIEKPNPDAGHYMLGGLGSVPLVLLQADRDWRPFLPTGEVQSHDHLETENCTCYGTEHAAAILMRRLFGPDTDGDYDWSERFGGIVGGTTKNGNSPHAAAEAIRNFGLLDAQYLPFSASIDSWDSYYTPAPMTKNYLDLAAAWLKSFSFNHDWSIVGNEGPDDKAKKLFDALQYSPQGISVYAWEKDPATGMYVRPNGVASCHWVTLVYAEWGKYWVVFDTYPDEAGIEGGPQSKWLKVLSWDHLFGTEMAKRYYIVKKNDPQQSTPQKNRFVEWLLQIINALKLIKWHA